MDLYLYWPFARIEDVELFESIPADGDHLTLHTIDRPGAPTSQSERLTILRELPEVNNSVQPPSPRWAGSRARTYVQRTHRRGSVLRRHRFDSAHLAFLNQYTDLMAVRRLARSVPLTITVHDVVPHTIRLPESVQHRLLDALYRSCGSIVVHHDDVRTELLARFNVDPEAVTVVPHWVSTHRTGDSSRVLGSPPTVLFLGTLRANKGIDVLIDAIEMLAGEEVRFVIAGRGDQRIEAAIEEAGRRLPNLRAEIGWVTPEHKRELLLDSDLCVMPYTSFSSQSGVLHDAYGAHLPVVVTDVGALGSSVSGSGTGLVVPTNDAEGLAGAIAGLLTDPERWSRMSLASRAVAERQSCAAVAELLRNVYASRPNRS